MKTELQEHLDAHTTPDNKWNNWPDQLEIVKTSFLNLDYDSGYAFGYHKGRATADGAMRQIQRESIPYHDALVHLPTANRLVSVWFAWALAPGQESGGTPNVLVLFERHQSWSREHNSMVTTWPGMILEIGCNHNFQGKRLGNCYHETKCDRCGWWYRVDSSG